MHVSMESTCPICFRKLTVASMCLVDSSKEIAKAEIRKITAGFGHEMVGV